MDEAAIQRTLETWARAHQLDKATLSEDGKSLSLDSTTIPATTILEVSHEGRSCSYSVASIYLQLLDPNQSLPVYRSACKKYSVKDPIKSLEKPVILGSFLGLSTGLASESTPGVAAAAASTTAVAPSEAVPTTTTTDVAAAAASDTAAKPSKSADRHDKDRKKSSSKPREHSSSKRKEDHQRHKSSSSKHKKPKPLDVDDEQLFDRLNVVVDKRQLADHDITKVQEELTLALSPAGFEVTPELMAEHKERAKRIMSNEIPVGTSASILRAANPRKDLTRVLELFNEAVNASAGKGSKSSRTASGSRHDKPPAPPGKPVRKHLIGKKPIIIVPKGQTACITLANAHDFLCNANYTSREVLVKQGRHRSPSTTFTRTVKGATGAAGGLLEYEIIDNPRKLGNTEQEWDRVVAVIVLGHSWQFKDWLRGYNAPATLFEKAFGYFVNLEGDIEPAEVAGWGVHKARINRDKRASDRVAHASFWNRLDEWMQVHKPELLPHAGGTFLKES
jgi:hypothetical protein